MAIVVSVLCRMNLSCRGWGDGGDYWQGEGAQTVTLQGGTGRLPDHVTSSSSQDQCVHRFVWQFNDCIIRRKIVGKIWV